MAKFKEKGKELEIYIEGETLTINKVGILKKKSSITLEVTDVKKVIIREHSNKASEISIYSYEEVANFSINSQKEESEFNILLNKIRSKNNLVEIIDIQLNSSNETNDIKKVISTVGDKIGKFKNPLNKLQRDEKNYIKELERQIESLTIEYEFLRDDLIKELKNKDNKFISDSTYKELILHQSEKIKSLNLSIKNLNETILQIINNNKKDIIEFETEISEQLLLNVEFDNENEKKCNDIDILEEIISELKLDYSTLKQKYQELEIDNIKLNEELNNEIENKNNNSEIIKSESDILVLEEKIKSESKIRKIQELMNLEIEDQNKRHAINISKLKNEYEYRINNIEKSLEEKYKLINKRQLKEFEETMSKKNVEIIEHEIKLTNISKDQTLLTLGGVSNNVIENLDDYKFTKDQLYMYEKIGFVGVSKNDLRQEYTNKGLVISSVIEKLNIEFEEENDIMFIIEENSLYKLNPELR